jgi:hypothetical protein
MLLKHIPKRQEGRYRFTVFLMLMDDAPETVCPIILGTAGERDTQAKNNEPEKQAMVRHRNKRALLSEVRAR